MPASVRSAVVVVVVVVDRPVLFDMAAHSHIAVVFVDTVVRFDISVVVVVVADTAAAVFAATVAVVAAVFVVVFAAVVAVDVMSRGGSRTVPDPRCCENRLNLKL